MIKIIKTFLITYLARDGEHEYVMHNLIEGDSEKLSENEALKMLKKGGYKGDNRIYELEDIKELTNTELETLKKYINYF
ncbi:hypothetical protein KJ980_00975 [Patescibacteria group bacterium]|nr:hypothetical protein [Patescibacteria group bacterium]MBU4098202.1 hypothetical protein [Patescibacteria group bacterium]